MMVFVKDVGNGCKDVKDDGSRRTYLCSIRRRGCKFRDFWRNSKFEVVKDLP
jgi:hypothetical protein